MATKTDFLGLTRFGPLENRDHKVENVNFDLIDEAIKGVSQSSTIKILSDNVIVDGDIYRLITGKNIASLQENDSFMFFAPFDSLENAAVQIDEMSPVNVVNNIGGVKMQEGYNEVVYKDGNFMLLKKGGDDEKLVSMLTSLKDLNETINQYKTLADSYNDFYNPEAESEDIAFEACYNLDSFEDFIIIYNNTVAFYNSAQNINLHGKTIDDIEMHIQNIMTNTLPYKEQLILAEGKIQKYSGKTLLLRLIDVADKCVENQVVAGDVKFPKYTATSFIRSQLDLVLKSAKTVAAAARPSAAQINTQINNLEMSFSQLIASVDKTQLYAKIIEAEALNEIDYSLDSFNALETKLISAKVIFNNNELANTVENRKYVSDAIDNLNTAMESLIKFENWGDTDTYVSINSSRDILTITFNKDIMIPEDKTTDYIKNNTKVTRGGVTTKLSSGDAVYTFNNQLMIFFAAPLPSTGITISLEPCTLADQFTKSSEFFIGYNSGHIPLGTQTGAISVTYSQEPLKMESATSFDTLYNKIEVTLTKGTFKPKITTDDIVVSDLPNGVAYNVSNTSTANDNKKAVIEFYCKSPVNLTQDTKLSIQVKATAVIDVYAVSDSTIYQNCQLNRYKEKLSVIPVLSLNTSTDRLSMTFDTNADTCAVLFEEFNAENDTKTGYSIDLETNATLNLLTDSRLKDTLKTAAQYKVYYKISACSRDTNGVYADSYYCTPVKYNRPVTFGQRSINEAIQDDDKIGGDLLEFSLNPSLNTLTVNAVNQPMIPYYVDHPKVGTGNFVGVKIKYPDAVKTALGGIYNFTCKIGTSVAAKTVSPDEVINGFYTFYVPMSTTSTSVSQTTNVVFNYTPNADAPVKTETLTVNITNINAREQPAG